MTCKSTSPNIANCGLISQYNSEPFPIRNLGSVKFNRSVFEKCTQKF
jgi:hypothetical protein